MLTTTTTTTTTLPIRTKRKHTDLDSSTPPSKRPIRQLATPSQTLTVQPLVITEVAIKHPVFTGITDCHGNAYYEARVSRHQFHSLHNALSRFFLEAFGTGMPEREEDVRRVLEEKKVRWDPEGLPRFVEALEDEELYYMDAGRFPRECWIERKVVEVAVKRDVGGRVRYEPTTPVYLVDWDGREVLGEQMVGTPTNTTPHTKVYETAPCNGRRESYSRGIPGTMDCLMMID
ncbi:hypothetical protein BJ508DRAFT_412700 [Ascobolus immersus RN42]|uniref:Uncharacterized protein n=1 Tax=Ascobolus immersus RN42 TaxID=1160509 RepID=A0A3N4IHW8_ASCIM|nr:hypothetical protein BJ508DRAFT_412700 [Ascobolus immersus RN42]